MCERTHAHTQGRRAPTHRLPVVDCLQKPSLHLLAQSFFPLSEDRHLLPVLTKNREQHIWLSMGSQEQLLWVTVLALFFQGITVSGNTASGNDITIEQKGKKVSLVCKGGNNETRWFKGEVPLTYQGKELVLAVMDDPRGIYVCINSDKKSRPLQVFIRMCQNCIHLDFTTILGISAASLITTIFLAIAVYHIAVEERGRPAQASDKQCLLANDQLYQPLQEHNDKPYSHIGIAKPRRR